MVTEHLALYHDLPLNILSPKLAGLVRRFVEQVRDQVGLDSPPVGAPVRVPASYVSRVFGRPPPDPEPIDCGGPDCLAPERLAWREPILLALGYVVWKWTPAQRQELLNRLLIADDPLGTVLPRTALFVVDALTEMQGVPEESFPALIPKLLVAYADRGSTGRFPALKTRIEEGFSVRRSATENGWMKYSLRRFAPLTGQGSLRPPRFDSRARVVHADHRGRPRRWAGERQHRVGMAYRAEPTRLDLSGTSGCRPPIPTLPDAPVRAVLKDLARLETGEMLSSFETELAELAANIEESRAALTHAEEALRERELSLNPAGDIAPESQSRQLSRERDPLVRAVAAARKEVQRYDQVFAQVTDLMASGDKTREEPLAATR